MMIQVLKNKQKMKDNLQIKKILKTSLHPNMVKNS